jgi:hypothetical protein
VIKSIERRKMSSKAEPSCTWRVVENACISV